eukprot:CAMPEP_0115021128 /NCGR_PEP_ID=MMETSP0216-20121206/30674_1 /TAXON_ID=223996 /ORGANISM="Protocruzia adherens, Strain Boccale" /LENGTH=304 /DNA_ID=CAMNT_0002393369 /DNA_START=8 /DNA_END=922 /DNA_ORIENTATION=-
MVELNKFKTLSNGFKIPQLGLGTFRVQDESLVPLVKEAVKIGYRHIDTAEYYQNHKYIGQALTELSQEGFNREELFITTKVWVFRKEPQQLKDFVKEALEELQLEYIDLFLLHWPFSWEKQEDGSVKIKLIPLAESWKAMEELVDEGLVKSIGLSNFNTQITLDLLSYARIKPVINQIETNPSIAQTRFVSFFEEMGVHSTAYAPLGAPYHEIAGRNLTDNELIVEMAKKYGKTSAQILLNWGLTRGTSVIPRTTKIERLTENFESLGFTLSEEDVEKINSLDTGVRAFDPAKNPKWHHCPIFN